MAFNLRNRNFLKLLDFTPEEIKFLLKLAADLKADGQKHCPHLRKDLDPHPLRLRGWRQGPRCPRHLSRPHWLTDRHQGIDG